MPGLLRKYRRFHILARTLTEKIDEGQIVMQQRAKDASMDFINSKKPFLCCIGLRNERFTTAFKQ